ncbi:MAG: VCBS repeat-containing protein [Bacteroidetes bacterium]|nr:VCBS repeat-containing protein [Bacteroidota bacterium]
MLHRWSLLAIALILITALGCNSEDPLFTLMDQTGISFENRIVEQDAFNVLEYEYFYNGGGVAAGDLNNDGLVDLYFTANMAPDHLYRNLGDWSFEEVTLQSGIIHSSTWTTGVTMADVNSDGFLDIYVCRSGNVSTDRRRNALYINQGDFTFKDEAKVYGLDDPSYSNHATFFDYDRDGDLDMYLLNHSIRRYSHFVVDYMRAQRDSLAGDKLFRNDGEIFTDVTEEAGIIGNPLSYGLSVVVSDINGDFWPDLYISNDYIEDDYLYINQQDGTFKESIRSYLTHTSYASMGADIADINNDEFPDIYTLDMLAEDNYRQKVLKGPENYQFYHQLREDGFHEQYMRNMLHVRRGLDYIESDDFDEWKPAGFISTAQYPGVDFTEMGQFAGVSNTDWSWAPIFADLDLDGHKDLIVTNGYLRDYTDLDFLSTLREASRQAQLRGTTVSGLDMVNQMPTTRVPNYVFKGQEGIQFQDVTSEWGFDIPSHSNGMTLADLDGDLDLDIVINNINQPPFIYRNHAQEQRRGRALRITLKGSFNNLHAIGSKIIVYGEGHVSMMQEANYVRGYLSSLEPALLFGTGDWKKVNLSIFWPNGEETQLDNISTDQTIHIQHNEIVIWHAHPLINPPIIYQDSLSGIEYQHQEDSYSDWDIQPLLHRDLAQEGPAIASGDINGDGFKDLFVGGGRGQASVFFLQQVDSTFMEVRLPILEEHAEFEDVAAELLDVTGDGMLDLYVASGSGPNPDYWQDRVYVNSGFGQLVYIPDLLPAMKTITSSIASYDFDEDEDLDLFIGSLHVPGQYGKSPPSYLLENTPDGFIDRTTTWTTGIENFGMISTAVWANVIGDESKELLIAGHWMPIRVFCKNNSNQLEECSHSIGLADTDGFWNTIFPADLDGDGDIDLVAGNRGLNTQIHASTQYPATLYVGDLDHSGSWEVIYSSFVKGIDVPVATRDQMVSQLPDIRLRFPTYSDYAAATTADVISSYDETYSILKAHHSASVIFELTDQGVFELRELPLSAQFSPIRDVLVNDFDRSGHQDILFVGNDFSNRAEEGRMNGGRGGLLLGYSQFNFKESKSHEFWVPEDARRLIQIDDRIIVANNQDRINVFQVLKR